MENWTKKHINLIIAIFILLQPILDLLTGICVNTLHFKITIGIICRLIFLAYIVFVTIFIFKKKKLIVPYLIIGLYFILYLLGGILYKDSGLLTDLQGLVRSFYFPILLLSFYEIREEIHMSNTILISMVLIYLIAIFIPTLAHVGYKSYQITKAGTLGFFNSANEISGIFSILTPIMFIVATKIKKTFPIILYTLLYLAVILMIGTKTPLLSLGITLGISVLYLWNHLRKQKKYSYIVGTMIFLVCCLLALSFVIPKTNFYKNIKTHLDYLELDNVFEVFQDKELVDHFIFSSRLKFMKNKNKIYQASPIYQKLFGIGYFNKNKETKLIEMDYFDILDSHGIIGFTIYFMIVLGVLFQIGKNRKKKGYENGMRYLSIFFIFFLALFTGHILTAPSVSLIAIILLLSIEQRKKKRVLITGYDLEIGGIEKALVNFLDNIEDEKYDITLVLEKKKGTFLDTIKKSVKVEELKVSENSNAIVRKAINFSRKAIFYLLESNNYDFSCCYTTYSYSSNVLARIASKNNAFYVHSNYKYVIKDPKEFREFFDTRKVEEFKKIIFVSEEARTSFLEQYPELKAKTYVLNNFINTEEVIKKSKEWISIHKPSGKILFVFVGRLEEESKKLSRAIHLIKEIKDGVLWIIGDGPDRKKAEAEATKIKEKEKVVFFGAQKNPYPYMREADYILLTSDYEGFPVTYLEALCLQKEIITTIRTTDEKMDMQDYAYIISKEEKEMIKEVKNILKEKKKKKKIDLQKIQQERKKIVNQLIEDEK